MIRIVQGNPGSGKSYYAVNYLAKFSTYDDLYKEHTLNDGVLVITNLEGLKIKHLDFEALVQRFTVEKFLTVANFEIIIEKYRCRHVVLIIDEAQKYLDSKFYDKDVFYFFQYHRHLGIDIFLLTQSVSTICRQLPPLSEFILQAAPRSKGVAGTFRYKFTDCKGQFLYSQAVKKNQTIFRMYKSFSADEAEKPKNVLTHWVIVLTLLILVAGGAFKFLLHSFIHKGDKNNPKVASVTSKPLPVSSVSVSTRTTPSTPVFSNSTGHFDMYSKTTVVVGYVDGLGSSRKYLLSNGELVLSKRPLQNGQVYNP